MTTDVIAAARAKGQKIILFWTLALAAIPPLIALIRDMPVWLYGGASLSLALLALIVAKGQGLTARLGVTTALMGAVMLITASLTGHPWQLDSHMLYFAALAGAVTLVRYPGARLSAELAETLRATHGVLVVPGVHFGLEHHLRIGIGGNVWDADGFLCGIVQQAGLPRVSADLACELFEMLLEPITTQVPFIPPEHSGRPSGTANRPAPGGTDLADLLAGGR
mgnify:CR=1 FL=1